MVVGSVDASDLGDGGAPSVAWLVGDCGLESWCSLLMVGVVGSSVKAGVEGCESLLGTSVITHTLGGAVLLTSTGISKITPYLPASTSSFFLPSS